MPQSFSSLSLSSSLSSLVSLWPTLSPSYYLFSPRHNRPEPLSLGRLVHTALHFHSGPMGSPSFSRSILRVIWELRTLHSSTSPSLSYFSTANSVPPSKYLRLNNLIKGNTETSEDRKDQGKWSTTWEFFSLFRTFMNYIMYSPEYSGASSDIHPPCQRENDLFQGLLGESFSLSP